METFEAACANCESWKQGACARGLAPPAGEPRCDAYQISDAFASRLAGLVMKDVKFELPIPTRSFTKTERRANAKRAGTRPRRGFRS